MKSRGWPGIEGDGVKFPWTYAPHGVKGDKRERERERIEESRANNLIVLV